MRHFEFWRHDESHDTAWKNAETGLLAALLAEFKQKLKAETDSEKGLVLGDVRQDGGRQVSLHNFVIRIAARAHAGNDQFVGPRDAIGIVADFRGAADFLQRFLHA